MSSTLLDSDNQQAARQWKRLVAGALRYCGIHDAEDIAQEEYLKGLESGVAIEDIPAPIRGISRAIDKVRKRDREARDLRRYAEQNIERFQASPLLVGIADPEKKLEVTVASMLLHQILEDLDPPTCVAVLKLIFLENLSYAQVSEALDKLPGTVRQQVSRGVIQLREHLEAEGLLNLLREALLP